MEEATPSPSNLSMLFLHLGGALIGGAGEQVAGVLAGHWIR